MPCATTKNHNTSVGKLSEKQNIVHEAKAGTGAHHVRWMISLCSLDRRFKSELRR